MQYKLTCACFTILQYTVQCTMLQQFDNIKDPSTQWTNMEVLGKLSPYKRPVYWDKNVSIYHFTCFGKTLCITIAGSTNIQVGLHFAMKEVKRKLYRTGVLESITH